MKRLHILDMMFAVLVAVGSVAEEDASVALAGGDPSMPS